VKGKPVSVYALTPALSQRGRKEQELRTISEPGLSDKEEMRP
jgi:hypothetical protein